MKFAGNGATSLFRVQPSSKVDSDTITMHDVSVIFF
jgi:hypothetical protein